MPAIGKVKHLTSYFLYIAFSPSVLQGEWLESVREILFGWGTL
jgi:hypothetical protein